MKEHTKKSDGTLFSIEASASQISYSGKTILCVFVRDISDRKISEKALLQSEHRYRRLVENATDSIYLMTLDGKIRDANKTACKALGYSREELLELTVQDVDTKTTNKEFFNIYNLMADGTSRQFETIHRRKDGTLLTS